MSFEPVCAVTPPSTESVFCARFDVRLGRAPTLSSPATGGIALLAVQSLVLVADLECFGLSNAGASATNAMEHIVTVFAKVAPSLGLDAHAATWVEIDSEGYFDLVYPASGACTFGPIPSASGHHEPRSRGAFLEMFPQAGQLLLEHLDSAVAQERILH